jgi:GNAT superfamily N-acetyltransferase
MPDWRVWRSTILKRRSDLGEVSAPRPLLEGDDRGAFDCGRVSLNTWFVRHAFANHARGFSRVFVMTDAGTGRIVAYASLSAAQIERGFLPKALQRNSPDPLPVFLLGQLAVDLRDQGKGHSVVILRNMLVTALRAADLIGSVGVITHPLDEKVRGFYARYGFQDLPFDPRRSMMVRSVDLHQAFAE